MGICTFFFFFPFSNVKTIAKLHQKKNIPIIPSQLHETEESGLLFHPVVLHNLMLLWRNTMVVLVSWKPGFNLCPSQIQLWWCCQIFFQLFLLLFVFFTGITSTDSHFSTGSPSGEALGCERLCRWTLCCPFYCCITWQKLTRKAIYQYLQAMFWTTHWWTIDTWCNIKTSWMENWPWDGCYCTVHHPAALQKSVSQIHKQLLLLQYTVNRPKAVTLHGEILTCTNVKTWKSEL